MLIIKLHLLNYILMYNKYILHDSKVSSFIYCIENLFSDLPKAGIYLVFMKAWYFKCKK